ncbi:MAG: hypothetical protein K9G49_04625 [Taibaiella sp.]|nr:hypothetical protein [Taibaiella sp.]
MKQTICISFFVLAVVAFYKADAQITITKIPRTGNVEVLFEKETLKYYDSLQNFLGRNVSMYVGQSFYLKGIVSDMREYGFRDFYITNGSGLYGEDNYVVNPYKPNQGSFNSSYDELVGKYFEVLEVLPSPDIEYYRVAKEALKDIKIITGKEDAKSKKLAIEINKNLKLIDSNFFFNGHCFFKLREQVSGDIVYFKYNSKDRFFFPFIVLGYFEKVRQLLIGNKYVFADDWLRGAKDIETGKNVESNVGEIWKCVGLTIEDKFYRISPILMDSFGRKAIISHYGEWLGEYIYGKVFSDKEANMYRSKFGSNNFDSILLGRVFVGMSKEMCSVSLGKPTKIHVIKKSGESIEQWLYLGIELTFDNGLLKSIKDFQYPNQGKKVPTNKAVKKSP